MVSKTCLFLNKINHYNSKKSVTNIISSHKIFNNGHIFERSWFIEVKSIFKSNRCSVHVISWKWNIVLVWKFLLFIIKKIIWSAISSFHISISIKRVEPYEKHELIYWIFVLIRKQKLYKRLQSSIQLLLFNSINWWIQKKKTMKKNY